MKKGLLSTIIRVFVVLAVALGIAVLLITLRPKAQRQERTETARLVEVFTAKAENVQTVIEAFGTVQPRNALKLVAEVRGQVFAVDPSFEEGSYFNRGTRLIQIDPRTYELEVQRRRVQIQQAEADLKRLEQEVFNLKANIKIANSDVALARDEFNRLEKLTERKVVSQSTADKTEQRYLASLEKLQALKNQLALIGPQREQLKAQRNMAAVMLQQAELDLERTGIVAPFDGWVLEKAVEKGQHVAAGQMLGRIYSAGALEIEVRIPMKELQWFSSNLKQGIPIEADVIFDNDGLRQTWKGQVTRTKAEIDQKTRTLALVVEINQTEAAKGNSGSGQFMSVRLRPGLFVKVQIKGNEIPHAFVLPRHVVHPGDVVYTVEDNRIKVKRVTVRRRYKESVIIDAGLSDGELLVDSPLSGAVDGMRVRMKP